MQTIVCTLNLFPIFLPNRNCNTFQLLFLNLFKSPFFIQVSIFPALIFPVLIFPVLIFVEL